MRWKYLSVGLLIIALLLATAGYLFLKTLDFSRYKDLIAKVAEDATDRKVTLGGHVDLAIGFWPALVITKVTVANTSWGAQPEMCRIQRLEAQLSLFKLLLGDVDLKQITMHGVDLWLETDAAGVGNWKFKPRDDGGGHIPWTLKELNVGEIRIEDLNLYFQSGLAGSKAQLSVGSLSASKNESEGVLQVKIEGEFNNRKFAISGQTGLISDLFARKKFTVDLSGRIADAEIWLRGDVADVVDPKNIDLSIHASGKNLAAIASAVDLSFVDTDHFVVEGRVKGSGQGLSLRDSAASFSIKDIHVSAEGGIGDLFSLNNINLMVKASGKNLAEAEKFIQLDLPETGPFTINGTLTGSRKAIAFLDVRGRISRQGLDLALGGSVNDVLGGRSIHLNVEPSGKNIAEVGPLVGQKLPKTGPFKLSGRLVGSAEAVAVLDARGMAIHRSLILNVKGSVKDLLRMSGMNLNIDLSGKNLGEIGSLIDQILPETGPFTLNGSLIGSHNALALRNFHGQVSHRSLSLTLNGAVESLTNLNGLDLSVHCAGERLSDLGSMFGERLPELGRFDLKSQLTGSSSALGFNRLVVLVGQSDLNGSARVELRKRPKITAELNSALLDLTPIVTMETVEEKKIAETIRSDRGVFSNTPLPFDKLEALDADITVNAQNIRAINANWELGRIAVKLQDAGLRIEKLEAVYKGTKISASASVDPGSPHQVATKFLVQGFDLGAFLKEIQFTHKAEGYLDIAVDVTSKGDSVTSLMEHLNGSVGVVMGKGRLSKYLDWLAQDLTQKVIPYWGKHEKAGVIDCGAVQFDIQNGLAKSHGFVLNTPVSVLTGKGTINLANENIQFVLKPAPKHFSFFSLATKLRVTGTIQNPEVGPDYRSLASKGARALSTFVVGPVGLLTPFVRLGAKKQHSCEIAKLDEENLQTMTSK